MNENDIVKQLEKLNENLEKISKQLERQNDLVELKNGWVFRMNYNKYKDKYPTDEVVNND